MTLDEAEHLQPPVDDGLMPLIVVKGIPEWARLLETSNCLCSHIAKTHLGAFAVICVRFWVGFLVYRLISISNK
ncbi:MAG: hypothetical protein PVG14_08335 [Anaerolineales bacterium]|jgi:hypothetical protein